ncbi:winged helix-turn-helix transcriptional regulator [Sphingobacterium sp. Mn56C]|uniref:winged helix-turn-helix transcriptional regulator n=1 Tax=Sphingobacterium sp. Mn56C TaxID=3395261 RepID=UPI003BD970FF
MEAQRLTLKEQVCKARVLAIKDSSDILCGKWKIFILGTLMVVDSMRFMELLHTIDGIGRKMLSKELQDLEINGLVSRTVLDTKPISVSYALTEQGRTLSGLLDEIIKWGTNYRKQLQQ